MTPSSFPSKSALLDPPPLLGEEAGAVARHPRGERRLLPPQPGVEQLGDPPRLGEDDRLQPGVDEADEELERGGVRARLRPEEQQVAALARRPRLGDPVELPPGERLGELAGVGGGRRGGDQHRVRRPPSGRGGRSAAGRGGSGCRRCRGRCAARRARSSAGRRGTAPSRSSGRGRRGGACRDWRSPPAGNSCGSPSASRPGCRRRRSRTRRPPAAAPRPRPDGGTSPADPAPGLSGGRGRGHARVRPAPPPPAAGPGRPATCPTPWGW